MRLYVVICETLGLRTEVHLFASTQEVSEWLEYHTSEVSLESIRPRLANWDQQSQLLLHESPADRFDNEPVTTFTVRLQRVGE